MTARLVSSQAPSSGLRHSLVPESDARSVSPLLLDKTHVGQVCI